MLLLYYHCVDCAYCGLTPSTWDNVALGETTEWMPDKYLGMACCEICARVVVEHAESFLAVAGSHEAQGVGRVLLMRQLVRSGSVRSSVSNRKRWERRVHRFRPDRELNQMIQRARAYTGDKGSASMVCWARAVRSVEAERPFRDHRGRVLSTYHRWNDRGVVGMVDRENGETRVPAWAGPYSSPGHWQSRYLAPPPLYVPVAVNEYTGCAEESVTRLERDRALFGVINPADAGLVHRCNPNMLGDWIGVEPEWFRYRRDSKGQIIW